MLLFLVLFFQKNKKCALSFLGFISSLNKNFNYLMESCAPGLTSWNFLFSFSLNYTLLFALLCPPVCRPKAIGQCKPMYCNRGYVRAKREGVFSILGKIKKLFHHNITFIWSMLKLIIFKILHTCLGLCVCDSSHSLSLAG